MIITRTPVRISFCGGGTDLPEFYSKHGGAVVSMAINKYVYICINPKFSGNIRVSYSKTENVNFASEVKHDLVRESLRFMKLSGLEITSIADIPGQGSGLGSSSAFACGLMLALNRFDKFTPAPSLLAELAYGIERGCNHHCGKQDHYASAYGGLHFYKFNTNGHVEVEPICFDKKNLNELQSRLMLFWTGKYHDARMILSRQEDKFSKEITAQEQAKDMRTAAYQLRNDLLNGDIYSLGNLVDANWKLKRGLTNDITNPYLDALILKAKEAGAEGCKISGAGGGGFMLAIADPKFQPKIEDAVGLRRVKFEMEERGSCIIYED